MKYIKMWMIVHYNTPQLLDQKVSDANLIFSEFELEIDDIKKERKVTKIIFFI